ncbi:MULTISPECIES: hypothetical protein [unclassified Thalassospira]|uniref:hypothetical protein n=1 Tax=unclassified Thalassospira TaxID=2648997 RepID=UPI0007A5E827|nr:MULTISPECIES: hypothetical protein [unclassified Thalassospira]KZC99730.1 hypothetical protein AUQ41_08620 [Thalassospira sp. MCCC 1A02898]ONH85340.1 hypothetical protein TH47_05715 [Thalassospira sp. MCCC 1A02803]
MTQRMAAVPYREVPKYGNRPEVKIGIGRCLWRQLLGHSGKLTKEKIATMAEARFNSKQRHIKEFSGFEGPTWADIDPDTMELEKRDMIAAVEAAGFEVEA